MEIRYLLPKSLPKSENPGFGYSTRPVTKYSQTVLYKIHRVTQPKSYTNQSLIRLFFMLFYGSIVMLNCRNYTGDDIKKGTHYKPKQLVCLQILEMQTMFVYNSYKPPLKGKKIIKKS